MKELHQRAGSTLFNVGSVRIKKNASTLMLDDVRFSLAYWW